MATKSVRVMGDIVLVETGEGPSFWTTGGQRLRLIPDDGGAATTGLAAFTESGVSRVRSLIDEALQALARDAQEGDREARRLLHNAVVVLDKAMEWQRKVDGKEAA